MNKSKRLMPAALVMVLLIALAGCGPEPSSDGAAPQTPVQTPSVRGTIVAMGDSLTDGLGVDETEAYPALLEKKLAAGGHPFTVVNAGVSGETSSGALARIDWVISSLKPDLIILETGANDGLRGIDPDVLRKNLDRIVSIIKSNDIAVILCGMKMLPNLGPVFTQAFTDIYPEIAQKHAIPLIPFFLEGVAGDPQYNQPDRLHPTAEGYRRIVDHIYPYVLDAVKNLPGDFPPAPGS
ncbi:MAG: arylesterase [Desulfobacterales bacterium]|nr:arylesterase [Desulfobacterales bacterium]